MIAVGLALLVVGERGLGWLGAAVVVKLVELAERNDVSTSVMEDSLIGLDGRLVLDTLRPVFLPTPLLVLLSRQTSSLTPLGLLLAVLAKVVFKSPGKLLENTEGSAVSLGRDLGVFQSGFLTFL